MFSLKMNCWRLFLYTNHTGRELRHYDAHKNYERASKMEKIKFFGIVFSNKTGTVLFVIYNTLRAEVEGANRGNK